MGDVLVNVDTVSKRFCRSLKRSLYVDVQLRPDAFWAVK